MISPRPRMLWYKAMMPRMVSDGASAMSHALANCLSEVFDIDLVSLRLRGGEDRLAPELCPPFRTVSVVDPDNAGSRLKRACYRSWYELRSWATGVPRPAYYESGANVRQRIRELARSNTYDLAQFECFTAGPLLDEDVGCPRALLFPDAMHVTVEQEVRWRTRREPRAADRRRIEQLARYEVQSAQRADLAVFLSEADKRSFVEQGLADGAVVPVLMPPLERVELPLEGFNVLFLGKLSYPPNRDAVDWLVREIAPRVRAQEPRARFRIVGGGLSDPDRAALAAEGVEFLGFVPDLSSAMRDTAVFVAPVRMGTGVKIKVLEMMWYGLPMVATSTSATGTPGELGAALIADNAEAFADAVVELLRSRERRIALRDRAWELLDQFHCGPQARQGIQRTYQAMLRA